MNSKQRGEILNIFSQCGVSETRFPKISGDYNALPPSFSLEECRQVLRNYLGHSAFVLENFKLELIQERGASSHQTQSVFFAKFLPSLNQATNAMARSGPSMKEDFFYNILTLEYKKVGLEHYLDFYPKCFWSKINHALILEDLRLENYIVTKPPSFYTYDMLRLTVQQLAKLHASSLVYEELKSTELQRTFRLGNDFQKYFKEVLFPSEDNDIKKMTEVGIKAVREYFIPLFSDVARTMSVNEFISRSDEAFRNMYTKIGTSNKFRNTFCHGDVWATNVLFKFDENNHPVACKLIDYQLIRYCPPTQDLLTAIYLTTTKETRTKYMAVLVEEYYLFLREIVVHFGINMDSVMSKDDFKASCDYMKSQGICQAILYSQINLVDDRQDVFTDDRIFAEVMMHDRRQFVDDMVKKYPFYRARLRELIEDLYDVCENDLHKI